MPFSNSVHQTHMKVSLVLSTVLATTASPARQSFKSLSASDRTSLEQQLDKWKASYGPIAEANGFFPQKDTKSARVNGHTIDELERFHHTVQDVENATAANPGAKFSPFNQFALLTDEEFKGMLMKSFPEQNFTSGSPLPELANTRASEVDWSTSKCNSPIANQGQCGSCWAFASIGAVETAHCIATGELLDLSEQQVVSCSKNNNGCNGGNPSIALDWMQQGVCTEDSYPYTSGKGGQTGTCGNSCTKKKLSIGKTKKTSGEKSLMTVLESQPATVFVESNNAVWRNYKGGIVSQCPGAQNDHLVIAVGYGTSKGDYFKIKNSWGTEWGENGYMYLKRGMNNQGVCNVATVISYPELTGSSPNSPHSKPTPSSSHPNPPSSPNQPPSSPDQPPSSPNQPPSSPNQPPFSPNQPPSFPNQPPSSPNQPPSSPNQPPFSPNQPPSFPNQPPSSPNQPPSSPNQPPSSPNQPPFSPNQPPFSPDQPPFSPNQPPFSPNQPPFSPNQPPFSPNQQPFFPNQLPFSPNQLPFSPNKEPFSPNQAPFSPNQPQFSPNQLPFSFNQPPYSPKRQPSSPNQLPFSPNQLPFSPNQLPFSPNQLPFSPNQLPFSPNQLPFSPNKPPFSPNQPPFSPNQPPFSPNEPPYSPDQPPFSPNQPPFPPNEPPSSPSVPKPSNDTPMTPGAPKPSTGPSCTPSSGNGVKDQLMVQTNKIRAAHGISPVTWDDKLEAEMQKWAGGCPGFKHGGPKGSQNLATNIKCSGAACMKVLGASWMWYDEEEKSWNYASNKCNGDWAKCGHFTNMMSPETTSMACGWSECGGDNNVWCNYINPGMNPKVGKITGMTKDELKASLTQYR